MSERKTYRLDDDVNEIVQSRKHRYVTENECVNALIRESRKLDAKDLEIEQLRDDKRELNRKIGELTARLEKIDAAFSVIGQLVIGNLPTDSKPSAEPASIRPPPSQ